MSEGILQFALGLETGSFIGNLDNAGHKMLEFIASGEALTLTVEKMWGAIEKGAALKDLAARTGESVGMLYQLQEAFKGAGLGMDQVSPMLLHVQRSLSGVSEAGESTLELFSALGLNLGKLRAMNGADQIQTIAQALSTLPRDQAAGIAGRLFGRDGAGGIMEIARSLSLFKETFNDAGKGAAIWQQSAAAFKSIEHSSMEIKSHIENFWAGVAEGAAPAIEAIQRVLKSIDFETIGQNVGGLVDYFFNAFETGKLSELISQSMKAGIEEGTNFLVSSIGAAMLVTEKAIAKALGKDVDPNASGQAKFAAGMSSFGGSLAMDPVDFITNPLGFVQGMARSKKADPANPLAGLGDEFAESFKKMWATMPQNQSAALATLLQSIGHSPAYTALLGGAGGFDGPQTKRNDALDSSQLEYKMQFSSLEKMGFVMSGRFGNPLNTEAILRRQEELQKKMVGLLGRLTSNFTPDYHVE